MAALGRQRNPGVLAGEHPGHAQTRTGADDQAGRVRLGFTRLHFDEVVFPHVGNAQCLGGEVIDDFEQRQIQRLLNVAFHKVPMVVGHLYPLGVHRAGERQAGFLRGVIARCAYPSEIVLNRFDHAGVIGAG